MCVMRFGGSVREKEKENGEHDLEFVRGVWDFAGLCFGFAVWFWLG